MSTFMWCNGCRASGAVHCAHPDECGYMRSATVAAENWIAWLDDVPIPDGFDPAIGGLMDFLTALAAFVDMPQPAPPAPGPSEYTLSPEFQRVLDAALASAGTLSVAMREQIAAYVRQLPPPPVTQEGEA